MTHKTPATLAERFAAALERLPLVAILRGLRPDEAADIGQGLYDAGLRLIEVPLNSPDPLDSIGRLRQRLPADALVGAGTVLAPSQVGALQAVGGELVVMPHADVQVIQATKGAGLVCVPGIATPTEAFAALAGGADALKIFPAELVTPQALKAMRAVLPPRTTLLPVGGITPERMQAYLDAGASGFGLGSALYAPGCPRDDVVERARRFVQAWERRAAARAPS